MQAIRLLPAVFLFAGALIATNQFLQERLERYTDARNVFVESLGQTRASLVNGVWQSVSDPMILQNLEWNNLNSVGQTLQNYLRAGEVSQMEFLDVDCNLIVRAPASAKPIATGCKPGDHSKPVLRWQTGSDQTPTLTLTMPRTMGGKTLLVSAHVVLDQGWLSAYPELMRLVAKNDFSLFSSSNRGLLWRDGYSASGDALVTFSVGGWLSRFLPNLMKYSLEAPSLSLWWIFALLAVTIMSVVTQHAVAERKDADLCERFANWLKRLPANGKEAFVLPKDGELSWECLTSAVEKRFSGLIEQKQIQTQMMRERHDQLTLAAIQREKQMSDLQDKLASMADLASLKEQLQHSTSSFLKKMKDVRELCEDMFDISSEGLARQGKELHELVSRWKAGINDQSHRERGARKFLRTLSETPSTRPGYTKLDDELDTLGELTGTTMDQSLHLAMLSRQALSELESGVQVAALWLGLSMRENERERTSDWMECLLSAQRLVGAETRYSTLTFERLPQINTPEEMYPPVARIAIVSGFFHLYMALLADVTVDAISLPIVLRQKRFSDQGTMILSLPHPALDVADSAPGRGQGYHMELAKAILAPLGIRAAFLPPTIAGVPVAVSWTLPSKQVDISSSQVKQKRDEESLEHETHV